jgi:hypothetical protein
MMRGPRLRLAQDIEPAAIVIRSPDLRTKTR